jgi:hypothetical protein
VDNVTALGAKQDDPQEAGTGRKAAEEHAATPNIRPRTKGGASVHLPNRARRRSNPRCRSSGSDWSMYQVNSPRRPRQVAMADNCWQHSGRDCGCGCVATSLPSRAAACASGDVAARARERPKFRRPWAQFATSPVYFDRLSGTASSGDETSRRMPWRFSREGLACRV